MALTETIAATGLGRELSAALAPWRKPFAVHDPANVITDLAITLALGGDCMADVALLRAEPGVFGPVASDPTVSRTIDALAKNAPRAWALAGTRAAPDAATSAQTPLIVNLDATLVTFHSDKEHVRPAFKGGFGVHRCARSSTTVIKASATQLPFANPRKAFRRQPQRALARTCMEPDPVSRTVSVV